MKLTSVMAIVAAATVLTAASSKAALFFWDNGGSNAAYDAAANWSPDGVPGAADLAVHNTSQAAIAVAGDWSVDSLRLSNGGAVVHTAGTVIVANGASPDNGLWVGEFGPGQTSYTLNGADAAIQINDPNDGFMIGRAGGSVGNFTFGAGAVNNTAGDTHIGLDGTAVWNQTGGVFNGAGVHIGRFASPSARATLGGTSTWNVGLVLLADGHGVFNPRNPGPAELLISGPNVSFSSQGLVMMDEGTLSFDADGQGVSTLNLNNQQLLLNNGKLSLSNLPTPAAPGEVLVLLSNIGSYTGADLQFDNAPDGTRYGAWELDYGVTGQVRLVAVPESATLISAAMAALALGMLWRRR